ncbi:hypothetical protein MIH18_15590 [Marinobacter sp. M3C]|jgi:hypothetical protein|uniref:major coat protein n=1 Tax=unclassified Marinobacter TaxID=83889 RepID=UPI00200C6250|nr:MULTISPECIES: major coat protein [unclassified Marinobacter]MCL1478316.1 hypothetical protein [Marinobacter sp.]MCL1480275.1 hypothetical protein [Marinobacter sp.]MCL1483854.1 hypothetical protein [Marinobacter sp.]MCL1487296.1 hypothetical protein [Marinobacter sp.]UQG55516.1 hypothetical protein MIH16_19335 [Marinobacter sp. M4C]
MKQAFKMVKKNGVLVCVVSGLTALSTSAAAELPAAASAAVTEIGTTFTDLETVMWPIISSVVVGFIAVKLFKKFANKAS